MPMHARLILDFPCSDAEIQMVLDMHKLTSGRALAMPSPSDNSSESIAEPINDEEKTLLDKSSWKTHEDDCTPLMDAIESHHGKVKADSVASLMMSYLRERNGQANHQELLAHCKEQRPDLKHQNVYSMMYGCGKKNGVARQGNMWLRLVPEGDCN